MSVHVQVYLQHAHRNYGCFMHAARSTQHVRRHNTAKQMGHKLSAFTKAN